MFDAEVDGQLICEVKGHRSNAVWSYKRTNAAKKRKLSSLVQGQGQNECAISSTYLLCIHVCETSTNFIKLCFVAGGCTIVGTPMLAQANNTQMLAGCYDPEKPTSYIQFLTLTPSIPV